jgi:hypothetical protein
MDWEVIAWEMEQERLKSKPRGFWAGLKSKLIIWYFALK